ncbi:GSCOCG00012022001-RA-CDS [Cotesia congregata]|nr:GSCOCG00012022001-RA-CDS [Cotesia congregata]
MNEMYGNLVFECVVAKLQSVFKLDENHPNESVDVKIQGNNVILKTQSEVEYKADKSFLTIDEWNALVEWVGNWKGETPVMPRILNQRISEEIDENELLGGDDEIKTNAKDDDTTSDNEECETKRVITTHAVIETTDNSKAVQTEETLANDGRGDWKPSFQAMSRMLQQHTKLLTTAVNTIKGLERVQKEFANAKNEQYLVQDQINERMSEIERNMEQIKECMQAQAEANKKQIRSVDTRAALMAKKDSKVRCFECGDYGHHSYECPRKGSGLQKYYECNQFTTHKAKDCPERLERQKRNASRGNGKTSGMNRYGYFKNSRGFKQANDRRQYLKRKNSDNSGNSESKKPRVGAHRGRGGFKNSNQHRQNKNEKAKGTESAKGELFLFDARFNPGICHTHTVNEDQVRMKRLGDERENENDQGKLVAKFLADSGATEVIFHMQ